jgi:hypothetical protein
VQERKEQVPRSAITLAARSRSLQRLKKVPRDLRYFFKKP